MSHRNPAEELCNCSVHLSLYFVLLIFLIKGLLRSNLCTVKLCLFSFQAGHSLVQSGAHSSTRAAPGCCHPSWAVCFSSLCSAWPLESGSFCSA